MKVKVASPYPAVHRGGIRAVAMATPGITLPFCLLLMATMPASPPNRAIITSYMVGLVRANSSECAVDMGVIKKYAVEAIKPAITANVKFFMERRNNVKL